MTSLLFIVKLSNMAQAEKIQTDTRFWVNVGIMIVIAALFVAGLYCYQQRQLAALSNQLQNLEHQLAALNVNQEANPKTSPVVSQNEIITSGPENSPRLALTFDADMTQEMRAKAESDKTEWYDPEIIEILNEEQVPATFFLTGMWAETYPQVTKRLSDNELFEIESHSYQTRAFTEDCYQLDVLKSSQAKTAAVQKAQRVLTGLTGEAPTYFRFPGGCYRQQDLELINNLGLKAVQWNVISGDAFADHSSKISQRTLNQVQNGSIVIFHLGGPNAPHTASALERIIPELKERGFELVTLKSLLNPFPE